MEFEEMHWAAQTAIAFVIGCFLLAMMYWGLAPNG